MLFLCIVSWIILIVVLALNISTKGNVKLNSNRINTESEHIENIANLPYQKKYLLTRNEYYFYKKLQTYTEKHNLQILAKIRLADLIEVKKGLSNSDWNRYFSKIKSKHIDFAIVDNMKILCLIELDDSTHNQNDRKERDLFVNSALSQAGYKVFHTYGNTKDIEEYIQSINCVDIPNGNEIAKM